MSNRRLVKIKNKDGELSITYWKRREHDWDELSLKTKDPPKRELLEALSAMAEHAVEMIEAPESWADRVTVQSVKFDFTDDVQGVVITCLRKLDFHDAPMVINTPHFTSEPYSETDIREMGLYSAECAEAIEELWRRVFEFVDGDRAQAGLDFGQRVEQAAEEVPV